MGFCLRMISGGGRVVLIALRVITWTPLQPPPQECLGGKHLDSVGGGPKPGLRDPHSHSMCHCPFLFCILFVLSDDTANVSGV